jgi:hypothetical protein
MLDLLAPLALATARSELVLARAPIRSRPREGSEALGEFSTAAQQVRGPAGAFLTTGEKHCASLRRWLLHQPKTPPGDSPGSLLARPLPTPHAHTVPVSHRRITAEAAWTVMLAGIPGPGWNTNRPCRAAGDERRRSVRR